MGMFDVFYFAKGILPSNKVSSERGFQTKDLDNILDSYYVDSNRNIIKYSVVDQNKPVKNNILDIVINVYSYVFKYKTLKGKIIEDGSVINGDKYYKCEYQEYKITIKDNKLITANKIEDKVRYYDS